MLLCHFGLPATTSSFEMETFPAVIVKNAQLTLRSRLSSTNKSDFTVTGNVAFLTLEPGTIATIFGVCLFKLY